MSNFVLSSYTSEDMFKSAMSTLNVDIKKMPLGQLSKAQVQRGYAVLEELEEALNSTGRNRAATLENLSARFYQVSVPTSSVCVYVLAAFVGVAVELDACKKKS